MKNSLSATLRTAVVAAMFCAGQAQAQNDQQNVNLEDEDARISYSVGVNIGQSLTSQGLMQSVDIEAFIEGLRDQVNGDLALSEEEVMQSVQAFQQRMMDQQAAAMDEARAEAESFLAENAEREEVNVTDSGLQYMVLESGDGGPSPSQNDTVTAHYHGTLTDGTVFDSSVDRGEPAEFMLNQVIPGWTEALQMMSVGDRWRIFLPPELAYGPSGSGPIPPHSVLIFDVELLEVEGQEEGQ